MKIEIEKKDVISVGPDISPTSIYEALRDMKFGESFIIYKVPSHLRVVLGACKTLIGSHFAVRKEGAQYRIGRVK